MRDQDSESRLLSRLPYVLAAYPIAWLALLYLFVLRARLHIGHWPSPYHPDPKDLGFIVHHQAVWYGLMALPLFTMTTIVVAVIGRRRAVLHGIGRPLTFLAAGIVFVIGLGRIDPGSFIEWFAD